MPLNTTRAVIRMRLAILFLAITWLALAGLSSATVRFAVVLRDRAKSDLVNSSDSILDITFQSLMDKVVVSMVVVWANRILRLLDARLDQAKTSWFNRKLIIRIFGASMAKQYVPRRWRGYVSR